MKIPPLLIPDSATMHGYPGGMALYVPNWDSVKKFYKIPKWKRKTTDYTIYSLYKSYPINKN